jgi:hypothetical protein
MQSIGGISGKNNDRKTRLAVDVTWKLNIDLWPQVFSLQ